MVLLVDVINEVLEKSENAMTAMRKDEIEEIFKEFFRSDFSLKQYTDANGFYLDFLIWYGLYYRNPKTNMTILEEVLQKFDEETIDKVKNMKIISGDFSIRDLQKINNEYFVELFNKDIGEFLVKVDPSTWKSIKEVKNTHVLRCHIIYYGGKYYLFGVVEYIPILNENGFLTPAFIDKAMERIDNMRLKEIESANVTERTTLKQCLAKYPATWINEICDALNIKGRVKKEKIDKIAEVYLKETEKILEKLPDEALEILRVVLNKGGVIKYGELSRKFMDDTTYFYHNNKTPLGILRFYCIIFVGKMNIRGKNYRVAIIPSDLREKLKEYIK
ncbi:hypothetical protein [Saccharolobus shibatae]|uniref:Uncharacterized protein n=1 Tax=Saccharolobus shibatae TaxID=2286 RepID=A0A8F5H084_9CREN|nr:hypothetical protein [Saccharolobus shibatae]QXJ35327.1 hypothetical protein J5U22_01874 [Saccharolobus shibatae]